jgi:CubicO group peptidase (beta-lactamase class C family)
MSLREQVEPILRAAVSSGVTPGGMLTVADGGEPVDSIPFGRTQNGPPGEPVGEATVYDIASLTKPVATVAVFLRLQAEGRVALDTMAAGLVPELVAPGGEGIEIRHLLGHSAGFPDHVRFYQRLWAGDRAGAASARDAMVRMAGATELLSPPGAETRYSDVGFILLGAALERAGGDRLDRLARRLVLDPLGMASTSFVDLEAPTRPRLAGPVAPTEICPRRGLVAGEVHDENAHAAGGICGHAGLFATAGDLARFAAAMNRAVRGEPGLFDPALARTLVTTPSTPGSTWRLGWDTPSPEPGASSAGDRWSRAGFGHLGFTGCSMWLDAERERHAILLTNRVHPSRDGSGIRELRRAVMDAVSAALG